MQSHEEIDSMIGTILAHGDCMMLTETYRSNTLKSYRRNDLLCRETTSLQATKLPVLFHNISFDVGCPVDTGGSPLGDCYSYPHPPARGTPAGMPEPGPPGSAVVDMTTHKGVAIAGLSRDQQQWNCMEGCRKMVGCTPF